jgi:predicted transporter
MLFISRYKNLAYTYKIKIFRQQIFKIYLPIYLLVAFVIPTYITYKQTGIAPITFANTNPLTVGKILLAIILIFHLYGGLQEALI